MITDLNYRESGASNEGIAPVEDKHDLWQLLAVPLLPLLLFVRRSMFLLPLVGAVAFLRTLAPMD